MNTIELHPVLSPITNEIARLGKGRDDESEVMAAFNSALAAAREAIEPHRASFRDDFERELDGWLREVSDVFGQIYRTPQNLRGNLRAKAAVLANLVGVLAHKAHGPGLKDEQEGGD